jgi:hypothetical protein
MKHLLVFNSNSGCNTPQYSVTPALSDLLITSLNENMSTVSRSDTLTAGKGFSISVEKEAAKLQTQSGHFVETKGFCLSYSSN